MKTSQKELKLIECPRDAMQGLSYLISTEDKVNYINQLLQVGFDTIDFGSFVSPKAIPQMADTKEVVPQLNMADSSSKLLAIIANERGAKDACEFEEITYLGFPFSVSETFQQNNTNTSQKEAIERIKAIQDLTLQHNKQLVVYLSMAFGNPYGEVWNTEAVEEWVSELANIEIPILSLADTVGVANPESISQLFTNLIPKYPEIEFGAHFHSTPTAWQEKVDAAYNAGCLRIDSSLKGIGGCPMAKNELVGNIATENVLHYFEQETEIEVGIDKNEFNKAMQVANSIFH